MSDYIKRLWEIRNGLTMPAEKKPPKEIPKRSEKMKVLMTEYKPKVKAFLAKPENRKCKIKMEGCKGKAVTVHHLAGRTGPKLMDESDWMPSCLSCNLAVEVNDRVAREKGMKKSRLKK